MSEITFLEEYVFQYGEHPSNVRVERIADNEFTFSFSPNFAASSGAEKVPPPKDDEPITLDGKPGRIVHREKTGFFDSEILTVGLESTLDKPDFHFYSDATGAATFESALKQVVDLGYPIIINKIQDRGHYWFFPFSQIGSVGAVVNKENNELVSFPSGKETPVWLWAYEEGLLNNEWTNIEIFEIYNYNQTEEVLRKALRWSTSAIVKLFNELDNLPVFIEQGINWISIGPLYRDNRKSFNWRISEST